MFEVFCFVNCGESLGLMFCTAFDHNGISVNFTSMVNSLFTCMAGYTANPSQLIIGSFPQRCQDFCVDSISSQSWSGVQGRSWWHHCETWYSLVKTINFWQTERVLSLLDSRCCNCTILMWVLLRILWEWSRVLSFIGRLHLVCWSWSWRVGNWRRARLLKIWS